MMGRSGAGSGARDPRQYQIVALSTLLALGLLRLGFDIPLLHVVITLTSALAGQWLAAGMGRPSKSATRTSPPPFEWRSALISGISICLLLRTREPVWMALAGPIAVGSKFALRVPRA